MKEKFRNIENLRFSCFCSTATKASKVLVIVYGTLCLLMSFLASQMGSVLIAALSILGILGGKLATREHFTSSAFHVV